MFRVVVMGYPKHHCSKKSKIVRNFRLSVCNRVNKFIYHNLLSARTTEPDTSINVTFFVTALSVIYHSTSFKSLPTFV